MTRAGNTMSVFAPAIESAQWEWGHRYGYLKQVKSVFVKVIKNNTDVVFGRIALPTPYFGELSQLHRHCGKIF
ncbi:MAG: hypothetical protein PVI90_01855 [Desulfobacteraceae bacterium]|jgi:hypothetical protein